MQVQRFRVAGRALVAGIAAVAVLGAALAIASAMADQPWWSVTVFLLLAAERPAAVTPGPWKPPFADGPRPTGSPWV
ncbi:MAG: hypothetical protein JJT89_09515 [Nitriliruptoraceae bacterium]|nr:hypothetical protein [Nitriliruptoraceae bacterium]